MIDILLVIIAIPLIVALSITIDAITGRDTGRELDSFAKKVDRLFDDDTEDQ